MTQAMAGQPIKLGNLTPTRDLNYVTDTVEGFCLAAVSEGAVGETINVGTGVEISIGDLAQKILGMMGVKAEVVAEEQRVRPELSEVERLCASAERAKQVLGWSPKYDLDKGLEQTIAWIKERGGLYDVKAYAV